jgi:hypothetical protein
MSCGIMVTAIDSTRYNARKVGTGAVPPEKRRYLEPGDLPPEVADRILLAQSAGGSSSIRGLFHDDTNMIRCQRSFDLDGEGERFFGVSTKIKLGGTVFPVTVFIPITTPDIDYFLTHCELEKKDREIHPVEAMCDEKDGEGLKEWALPCFSRVFVFGEIIDDIQSDSGSDFDEVTESDSEPAEEDEIQSFSDDSDVIEEEREPKRRRV